MAFLFIAQAVSASERTAQTVWWIVGVVAVIGVIAFLVFRGRR